VVQRHDARALHFDLRLEHEGVLLSWAVPKGVPLRGGDKRLAVQTEPHPIEYLSFAGTIPDGQYGAGRMTIWDSGAMTPIMIGDDEIKVHLHGTIVDAEYHLVRTGEREWLLFRARVSGPGPDDPAGRFRDLRPMLATGGSAPFDDDAWSFEIKWDGWRATILLTADGCEIRSRTGRELTASFPRLADLRRGFDCQEAVLDGEICVLDAAGRSVFHDLQASNGPVTFVVFDLLYIDGRWIDGLPYDDRRARLRAIVVPDALDQVLLSDDVRGTGRALFDAVAASGGEGVIAKRRTSAYRSGARTDDWRKIKVRHELDGVICGYMPGDGSRRPTFGALIIGERRGGRLHYVGRVGSGFTDRAVQDLRKRLDRLVDPDCPFPQAPADTVGVVWVRPVLECRVAYSEISPEGVMRAPVFIGLADHEPQERAAPVIDLSASELRVRDDGREVRLTNLQKVFWPREGITKGEVLDHYARCASVLLPHLADRPLVMKRYPNGIDAPFFFQHAIPDTAPDWVRRATLAKGDDDITYALVDQPLALLWMANLGCIDLNPWHARVQSADRADYVLFDLDPQEGIRFDTICEVALLINDALTAHGLRAHAKTSGSRGMHVLVPIEPAPHDTVRLFAQLIATQVVHARPDIVTIEMAKARRGTRMYIDTNQNGFGKTIASVYSIRPVPGATVSTPVSWDEVAGGIDPGVFTMAQVAARIQNGTDLFAGVLRRDQDLAAVIEAM
jgi:bifunctional non-homologous end joining protein LigD